MNVLKIHRQGAIYAIGEHVSVFGLGSEGCVKPASLGCDSHRVIGICVGAKKSGSMKADRSSLIEPGINVLVQDAIVSGNLPVSSDTIDLTGIGKQITNSRVHHDGI